MMRLQIDTAGLEPLCTREEILARQPLVDNIFVSLREKSGEGNDFLGWVNLPSQTPAGLIQRISAEAEKIRRESEVVVIVGIGGSYLGTRAVDSALSGPDPELRSEWGRGNPRLLYAGHHLDARYHAALLQMLGDKDYSVIVISKSGTTTEPALAFRLLKKQLEEKYGKAHAASRITAVTDASRGALKTLADSEGYSTYVIPDDVGGRYSVLSPVGLLPLAVAGHNIPALVEGAARMEHQLLTRTQIMENPAALYAVVRNLLYQKGKTTEVMAVYDPALHYLMEWWKQLYGESEGKQGKGIFPASVGFTTDLHSMGQYIQDGMRHMFETVLEIGSASAELIIPEDPDDLDGLNFLSGKHLSSINKMAAAGTRLAHIDGGVPNLRICIDRLDEASAGELIYFFELGCAISGYMLGVNPFDQPGVEAYKKNMFALLGKPGFESLSEKLRQRLASR